jgi:hypothetical protein
MTTSAIAQKFENYGLTKIDVSIVKLFFYSSLTLRTNKLECLSLVTKTRAARLLWLKYLSRYKRSGLLALNVSVKGTKKVLQH